MSLKSLSLTAFRNLSNTTITCHPEWNLITGDNATGKTSLLESIYFLGRGRSFRASNTAELIQSGLQSCTVAGVLEANGQQAKIGIQRDANQTTVRINAETAKSAAQLARYLPVLYIGPDVHKIITEGPSVRRRFMDWGVFHLNEDFLKQWQRYQTALKNRNNLLRNYQSPPDTVESWHIALQASAESIDLMRQEFIEILTQAFDEVMQILLPDVDVQMKYKRGWAEDTALQMILQRDWQNDANYGHTRSGPHRADIQLKVDAKPAAERLSQGQRKLAAIALLVAQSYVFAETTGGALTLLVDDLPAELDAENRDKVLALFAQLDAQRFITATDAQWLPAVDQVDHQHFFLENGNISFS